MTIWSEDQEILSQPNCCELTRKFIYSVLNRKIKLQRSANLDVSTRDFEEICNSFQFKNDSLPFVLAFSTTPVRMLVASKTL